MLRSLLLSLILTELIELPIAWLWGLRSWNLELAALVNLLTNPIVVLLALLLSSPVVILCAELGAVAVEALCYARFGLQVRRPLLLSCTANLVSYGLGVVLQLIL